MVVQDQIALTGSVYKDCEINKFFDTMTTLFTQEGIQSAIGRYTAAQPFAGKQYKNTKADFLATKY